MRKVLTASAALLLALSACSSDKKTSEASTASTAPAVTAESTSSPTSQATPGSVADSTNTTTSESAAATTEGSSATTAGPPVRTETGPAPGVTANSIKVGVTYVDLKAIGDVASLNHGDYGAAFRAVIDDLNAKGGINGRTIDPVIVPVNPIGTAPAEAACVQLTEDEDVFLVIGFFQADSVLCPLETHQTAVIGGSMSPERLARAKAPWFTSETGTDLQSDIIRKMDKAGEFHGTLGVFASAQEEAQTNDLILPLLKDLGVEVKETAILQQTGSAGDITASNAQVAVVAERFRSSGVDQVLAIGSSALAWAYGVESGDYRPQLLLTDPSAIQAYATDKAGRDLSVLDRAIAGNPYGPAENIWKLPQMQECIPIVEAAGVPVPEPDTIDPSTGSRYIAGTTACNLVTLMRALLEAAGPNLNYGTLAAGANGLKVQLPISPDPYTYGPPPSADGDAPAYLYDWDPATKEIALRQG